MLDTLVFGFFSTTPAAFATWELRDLDLAVSTDFEDLASFAGDVFEASLQDSLLLLDYLTAFGPSVFGTLGAGAAGLLAHSWLKK